MDKGGNSENPRIIVLEPTCVGAVNTLKVYLVQSNVFVEKVLDSRVDRSGDTTK